MCLDCDDPESCAYEPTEHHPDDFSGSKPTDDNGRRYNPYQGSITPTDGRCNEPLSNWSDRYGEVRYCMALPEDTFVEDGSDRCRRHKSREALMQRAKELFTHGLYTKTIIHTFEHLSPWQKLTVLGWYEDYVEQSGYDFKYDLASHKIDFSDYEGALPPEIRELLDEHDQLEVYFPVPTEYTNQCYVLFRAAVLDMKAGLADRVILSTEDDTAPLERDTIVGVGENGPVHDVESHHLNVDLDRLDRSRDDLLEKGGVTTDVADDGGAVDANELVVDLSGGDDDHADATETVDSPAATLDAQVDES